MPLQSVPIYYYYCYYYYCYYYSGRLYQKWSVILDIIEEYCTFRFKIRDFTNFR